MWWGRDGLRNLSRSTLSRSHDRLSKELQISQVAHGDPARNTHAIHVRKCFLHHSSHLRAHGALDVGVPRVARASPRGASRGRPRWDAIERFLAAACGSRSRVRFSTRNSSGGRAEQRTGSRKVRSAQRSEPERRAACSGWRARRGSAGAAAARRPGRQRPRRACRRRRRPVQPVRAPGALRCQLGSGERRDAGCGRRVGVMRRRRAGRHRGRTCRAVAERPGCAPRWRGRGDDRWSGPACTVRAAVLHSVPASGGGPAGAPRGGRWRELAGPRGQRLVHLATAGGRGDRRRGRRGEQRRGGWRRRRRRARRAWRVRDELVRGRGGRPGAGADAGRPERRLKLRIAVAAPCSRGVHEASRASGRRAARGAAPPTRDRRDGAAEGRPPPRADVPRRPREARLRPEVAWPRRRSMERAGPHRAGGRSRFGSRELGRPCGGPSRRPRSAGACGCGDGKAVRVPSLASENPPGGVLVWPAPAGLVAGRAALRDGEQRDRRDGRRRVPADDWRPAGGGDPEGAPRGRRRREPAGPRGRRLGCLGRTPHTIPRRLLDAMGAPLSISLTLSTRL